MLRKVFAFILCLIIAGVIGLGLPLQSFASVLFNGSLSDFRVQYSSNWYVYGGLQSSTSIVCFTARAQVGSISPAGTYIGLQNNTSNAVFQNSAFYFRLESDGSVVLISNTVSPNAPTTAEYQTSLSNVNDHAMHEYGVCNTGPGRYDIFVDTTYIKSFSAPNIVDFSTYNVPAVLLGESSSFINFTAYNAINNSDNPGHFNYPVTVGQLSPASIVPGGTFSAMGSFNDPNPQSTSWTGTVDYGDGSGVQSLTLSGTSFALSHQYSTSGVYTVSVTITNDEGVAGTGTATITVDAPPSINGLAGAAINQGQTYTEIGSFTDPDSTSWTATVNYGDGAGVQPLSVSGLSFVLSHAYASSGTFTVSVSVTDNEGETATATGTVTVNVPPQVSSLSGASLNEADTYASSGSFSDADSTSWTGTADYGDGSGVQVLSLNSDKTFSLSHAYQEEGTYTVTVSITDNQGAIGTETASITVNDPPLTVGSITAPMSPTAVNTTISMSGSYADPGIFDTHTALWNWGDGNTSVGTIAETNGSGTVSDSHTYTTAGVYTVTLTVTDDDGVSASSQFQYIVIYDPAAGFITASGKYASQSGWDMQTTSATGDVKFGVQAKYSGSNTTPSGNAKFTFKVGDIDFASTSYQWLVVSGSQATLKGNGTINGTGNYTFLFSGIDGSNLVRFQIKDGSNNVIYDTQPGAEDTAAPTTSLTSGSIKVH